MVTLKQHNSDMKFNIEYIFSRGLILWSISPQDLVFKIDFNESSIGKPFVNSWKGVPIRI